jgi:cell division protein FtsI/penicillin-binding protein 2
MAAGLDSGAITPQSALDDTGSFVVGNQIIHNWNQAGFGYENMTQVLQHSANVGASWVAQRLGVNRFYSYMRRFQMNRPTGVDLQGEESGLMPFPGDRTWTIYNLYTNSFGQGLLITPLRLMTSIGAVANGGVMMKPQVVKQLIYDGRVIDHQPVSEGRVIKASTARTLTSMLVHSAIAGEAQMALVKGYNIAAKTGTASVADGHGGYLTGVTIASTIAYAPAYHPRFLVLVVLNHPRDQIWGSMTAAPTVHNIMQDLFTVYRIPPNPHPVPQ